MSRETFLLLGVVWLEHRLQSGQPQALIGPLSSQNECMEETLSLSAFGLLGEGQHLITESERSLKDLET